MIEYEFEDFAYREKSMNQVDTSESWAPWIAKWYDLLDGHGKMRYGMLSGNVN